MHRILTLIRHCGRNRFSNFSNQLVPVRAMPTPPISARIRRVIQVQDFHKNYDQTVAVGGLTFDVQPGQILGLLGPNGAGKTTTMRAIAGITPPTRGGCPLRGMMSRKNPCPRSGIFAYVPDDPKLFDTLTVGSIWNSSQPPMKFGITSRWPSGS